MFENVIPGSIMCYAAGSLFCALHPTFFLALAATLESVALIVLGRKLRNLKAAPWSLRPRRRRLA